MEIGVAYSVVIPTIGRPDMLDRTIASLSRQTLRPSEIIVASAETDEETAGVCEKWARELRVVIHICSARSAAVQRNEGAAVARSALIAFSDDDMEYAPDCMEKLAAVWQRDAADQIGGVAARIVGLEHRKPGLLLGWYYKLQAGYRHPHYGGHLFGPAINCLPAYSLEAVDLIPAQWLNSGCVMYSSRFFRSEQFPSFVGYSFMEDVHLSARIAKKARLFFHKTAMVTHLEGLGGVDDVSVERMKMRTANQKKVALEVMKLPSRTFLWKFALHRLFLTLATLRRPTKKTLRIIRGIWAR